MLIALTRVPPLSVCAATQRGAARAVSRASVKTMAGNRSLSNKNVAVIGASRGIGLEFVRQLLARGNTVHATARNLEGAKGLRELENKSAPLTMATLDVASSTSIDSWARLLKGERPFHYVFNVAGVHDPTRADLRSIDAEKMLYCFQTNTAGPLLVVQKLLDNGLLQSGTTIAMLTSKMGSIADNSSGKSYAYRASKAALNQVTKSLSIDLEQLGITSVLLHPGWVRTDMTSGNGLIDVDQCVSGLMSVLESDKPLNGRFYDYKQDEIPW